MTHQGRLLREGSLWKMRSLTALCIMALCIFQNIVFATNASSSDKETCTATDGSCQNEGAGEANLDKYGMTAEQVGDGPDGPMEDKKQAPLCEDQHESCAFWAEHGECQANPNYMLNFCQLSCKMCGQDGEGFLHEYGEPQKAAGTDEEKTLAVIEKTRSYMREEVVKPEFDSVRSECKNRHELCAFWSAIGECDANPAYMLVNCAPSCQTCHLIDFSTRCPLDPNAVDVFQPGDMGRMFERIVKEYSKVTVLSRPSHPEDADLEKAEYKLGPWVITIDDFLTEKECEKLIELAGEEGYERSMDVGPKKFDGSYEAYQSKFRTSENAWCKDKCTEDSVTREVLERIVNMTGVPDENAENLQMLRYEVGQFYGVHHDFIDHQVERQPGPRILTVFLYLNDVEEGGGTNFPNLNLTVNPQRGRVLIWPSVLDEDLNAREDSTHHEALPVIKGIKHAANGWLHLRDFKTPNAIGCV